MNAPWLIVANYLKGVSEYSGALTNPKIEEMFALSGSPWVHSDETPWCAAFVGASLRLAGYKSSNSLGARSYLNFGAQLDDPVPGCIVVFWRGDPKDTSRGHVAFLDHVDDEFIYVLGGNQGNMVQVKPYARNRVLAFRQPVETAPMAKSKVLRNFAELTGALEEAAGLPASAVPTSKQTTSTGPAPVTPSHIPVAPVVVPPEDADEPVRMGVPATAETSGGSADAVKPSQFGRVQPIVDKWEGGYVDHPADPGGATNMGVTIHTLARWRGHAVSKADVKALTRDEVWKIMKTYYYDVVRGDDLPIGVAVAVHNAAVLSGPKRAATWLQQSIQALGGQVTVDGAIGNESIGVVRTLDGTDVMEQFFRRQEQFYRSLSTFATFGKGWMNRLNDVRIFARKLQNPVNTLADLDSIDKTESVVDNQLPEAIEKTMDAAHLDPAVRKKLLDLIIAKRGKGALTPVNAALGTSIGNLLNGNKTTIGTLGLLASTLVNRMSPHDAPTITAIQQNITPFLQPVALTALAWGLLGKYEKWVYKEKS